MGTITLTNPVSGTQITAGLHATNYSAIQAAINGGLDSANWASGKIFAPSKLTQEGATTGQVVQWNGSQWAPGTITPGMTVLTDTLLTSTAASFDFTSIPSGYKSVFIRGVLRGDASAGSVNPGIRFNNDSGSNYDYELYQISGSSPTSAATNAATSFNGGVSPAATARASRPGFFELMVPNYVETTFEKVCEARSSSIDPGVASVYVISAGAWRSTAAITRITVTPSSGNWASGSHLTLYGIT